MTIDMLTAIKIYIRVTDALYVRPPINRPQWTNRMLRNRLERIKRWMGLSLWRCARDYSSHWLRMRHRTDWPTQRYGRGGRVV